MPGRRCFAREAARWDAPAHAATALALLRTHTPTAEHPLLGWPVLLSYLADCGIVRPNSLRSVSRRMVLRWAQDRHFPLIHGLYGRTPVLTSNFLVWAWLCSHISTGERRAFRVVERLLAVRQLEEASSNRGRPPPAACERPEQAAEFQARRRRLLGT